VQSGLLSFLEIRSMMPRLARRIKSRQMADKVELAHGLYIAALGVDRNLQGMEDARTIDLKTLGRIQARFLSWEMKASRRIEALAKAFPEAVGAVQKILGEREVIEAEAHALKHLREVGLLTEKAWTVAHEERIRRERILRRRLQAGA
jgi:hypothetical protein